MMKTLDGLPKSRSIRVYRPGAESAKYGESDTFVSTALPGFALSLAKLFEKLGPPEVRKPRKGGKK